MKREGSRMEMSTTPGNQANGMDSMQPNLPVLPLIRVSTCGPLTIEVLCQALPSRCSVTLSKVSYEAIQASKLRGRGVVPALTLLKLLVSCPHRYAAKDWLMEHLRPS